MANWQFNEQEVGELDFPLIPQGDYRCRIDDAVEKVSSTNKQMYELKIKVSGYAGVVFYYMVFDESNTSMVNTNLARIFESFKIPKGNLDVSFWKGKVGGVKIKHDVYNGETRAKVSYFLTQEKQSQLSEWQESAGASSVAGNNAPFNQLKESDIQF